MSLSKEDHAIVSVTAVKIQLSSPRGVLLSLRSPGIRITMSTVILALGSSLLVEIFRFSGSCKTKCRREVSIGDVKQQVNRSAGKSGDIGKTCEAVQAARWMASAYDDPGKSELGCCDEALWAAAVRASLSFRSADLAKLARMLPAPEHSQTYMQGL